jgi:DNA helicase-2/ATP-dependent DNA helicase PcrA
MIQWNDFESAVNNQLNRDISTSHDLNQHNSIIAPAIESLFIAAGPGSGKTTVIALRVLKLIFVDGVDPSSILLTTFTRRAAAQLRSRVLGWGDILRQFFISLPTYTVFIHQLQQINFNNIITGTLDSIAQDILSDPSSRLPGMSAPAVVESFISDALMRRVGLFEQGRYLNNDLRDYVGLLRGSNFAIGISEKSDTLIAIMSSWMRQHTGAGLTSSANKA